jgi:hypothetical protein
MPPSLPPEGEGVKTRRQGTRSWGGLRIQACLRNGDRAGLRSPALPGQKINLGPLKNSGMARRALWNRVTLAEPRYAILHHRGAMFFEISPSSHSRSRYCQEERIPGQAADRMNIRRSTATDGVF